MSKDIEYPITITKGDKIYTGRGVITIKGNKASQYVMSDDFIHSITDPKSYKHPSEQPQMESVGRLILSEILYKFGVDL